MLLRIANTTLPWNICQEHDMESGMVQGLLTEQTSLSKMWNLMWKLSKRMSVGEEQVWLQAEIKLFELDMEGAAAANMNGMMNLHGNRELNAAVV